jgi:hypothetical protein
MWSLFGLALALVLAAVAWRRSVVDGGSYDVTFYGMTPKAHRRYAMTSLAFAIYFALAHALNAGAAAIAGLAVYALIAAFYGTSFARGAPDADE